MPQLNDDGNAANRSTNTRQAVAWRARLALVFTLGGTAYLLTALSASGRLSGRIPALCTLLAATLITAAIALLRRASRLPRAPITAAEAGRLRRIVVAINILGWVGIGTAVAVLILLHHAVYIPTAAGILAGLYLVPLARAFHMPAGSCTAVLLFVCNVATLAMLPAARQPSTGALLSASVLLLGAAATLASGLTSSRRNTIA